MSFDSVSHSQALSQLAQISQLDQEIEEAHLTFQEELVAKLQKKRDAIMVTNSTLVLLADEKTVDQLATSEDKYLVNVDSLQKAPTSEAVVAQDSLTVKNYIQAFSRYDSLYEEVYELDNMLESSSLSLSQEERDELVDKRGRLAKERDELFRQFINFRSEELDELATKSRRGEELMKVDLQTLYFGRNFLSGTINGIKRIFRERDERKGKQMALYDLCTLFDCNYNRNVADSSLDAVIKARDNDLRIFVGEPNYELMMLLERKPDLIQNVHFFRAFPGDTFPVNEMTLEEMKNIAGV